MNILQITNTACSDTNQATGVNRVVTQLSDYCSRIHQDNCFQAFFEYAQTNNINNSTERNGITKGGGN